MRFLRDSPVDGHVRRPAFSAAVGKRAAIVDVSSSVTTNAAGGLLVEGGGHVAGTVVKGGSYDFSFTLPGGSVEAFVGGVSAGGCAGPGDRVVKLQIPNAATEFRFEYTPEAQASGAAILNRIADSRKFLVIFR